MLVEASDEIVDEEEDGIKLAVEGSCPEDMGLFTDAAETEEDKDRENNDEGHESQQAAVILTLVSILEYAFLWYLDMSENLFLSSESRNLSHLSIHNLMRHLL